MEGHVHFADLDFEFGYSCMPDRLHFYTKEENDFRMEVREWCKNNIEPFAEKIDRERNYDLAVEILRKMKPYLNIIIPKEAGGLGKGILYRTIFGEELTAFNYALAGIFGASSCLFAGPIIEFGTLEQKVKYLSGIADGSKIGAIGITEPTGGSDAIGGMRLKAVREGDHYVLNGEKCFITNGSVADYICLYTKTNDQVKAHQGITAFIFETNTPGFEVVKNYNHMGRRGMPNSLLRFNNCKVPAENMLHRENEGVEVLLFGLDGERTFTASQYLGLARSALEVAYKYAHKRVQFKKPLYSFEGISFKLSEMFMDVELNRMAIAQIARMLDDGHNCRASVAAVKARIADATVRISQDAVQIVGGLGYSEEYPLERYYRDAKIGQISAGTSEIMRYIITREMIRMWGK
ncbi:MAG: acyl-CoA/acyl-ACP dehydrogenase [Candidatus Lokiarchaeota archaeon]|jgi:butyryl-CoA dehydrogenase|nr:acyl-CoA/acyl-ACP dehydrogenase [Candidatus Lokiarchaeota archaeon]